MYCDPKYKHFVNYLNFEICSVSNFNNLINKCKKNNFFGKNDVLIKYYLLRTGYEKERLRGIDVRLVDDIWLRFGSGPSPCSVPCPVCYSIFTPSETPTNV